VDPQNWRFAKVKRNPVSLRLAFKFAWPTFKKHFGLFTAILLTTGGAWVTLEIVVIEGQRFGILLWSTAHLAFLIFAAGIGLGFLQICLSLHDGGRPTFSDTFAHLALGPKYLAGQILYLLMVLIGLALLVIPGIYLGVLYAMFGFSMASGETSLIQSFQESAILSANAKTSLLGILFVLFVLNVLGASLLGLGLFVTVPLSGLVMTAVYRQLGTREPVEPA
jgi:hypothetical protein